MNDISRAKELLESNGYEVNLICEMSKSWEDIKTRLNGKDMKDLILHLLKLYYWTDNEDLRNYCIHDILKEFNSIPLIKNDEGEDTYPTADQIRKEIWSSLGDEDYLSKTINDYQAISFCKEYIDWVAQSLSIDGRLSTLEGVELLRALYAKYHYSLRCNYE